MRNKVTLEDLKAKIVSIKYMVHYADNKMVAYVELDNGFSVMGESSGASRQHIDTDEKNALADAMRKIDTFNRYFLAEELYQQANNKKAYGFNAEQIASHMEDTEQDNAPKFSINIHDPVDNPAHYTSADNGIECIDAIEAALGREQFIGFLRGQVIKYQWRMGKKDNAMQDNDKSIWYANKLAEIMKG